MQPLRENINNGAQAHETATKFFGDKLSGLPADVKQLFKAKKKPKKSVF